MFEILRHAGYPQPYCQTSFAICSEYKLLATDMEKSNTKSVGILLYMKQNQLRNIEDITMVV